MLIENSTLENACLMMCMSAGEKEISTNEVCRVVQDNLQNQTIPKVINWVTAAQSATTI